MAKGNLILGTGSGSIGDVTMMRRNGAEVARVRLRKIKNPKSYGQAKNRMIAAMVTKLYGSMSTLLETSFEGLNRADSYSKFLSINNNLCRANNWGVPKGSGSKAFPAQISGGSLISPQYKSDEQGNPQGLKVTAEGNISTIGALSTAIINSYAGLQNGDQVTFLTISIIGDKEVPVYTAVILNTSSALALPEGMTYYDGSVKYDPVMEGIAGMSIIFSRWDGEKWTRSDSFIMQNPTYTTSTFVTNYEAAVESYMKGAGTTPISDVYLNGGE